MKAPYPYFGGKSRIAGDVWQRLGNVDNYVEPFFGSGAMLLSRPNSHAWWDKTETVNDLDGLVSNFWRAVQGDAEAVAHHADWPVNENDLHARHMWLVQHKDELQTRLEGAPDYFDAKAAGWWVWGLCLWIGSGWCSGDGPWREVDGQLVHLGDDGQGINRQRVHLGDDGQGINRKLVHLGDDGREQCALWSEHLNGIMAQLQDRLRRVRICSGDWSRVCGPTPTFKLGLTGVLLDPPYGDVGRDNTLYRLDDTSVAAEVREWAIANGNNPLLRIALCGYENEHELPGWDIWRWKTKGGYGSQGSQGSQNSLRECVWFSPHCLKADLFAWGQVQ